MPTFLGMQLAQAATFSQVRITDPGSIGDIGGELSAVDVEVAIWTRCARPVNPFATVDIRGVADSAGGLIWLPGDAEVQVARGPRYAGPPEDLAKLATRVEAPEGSKGALKTADGWPPLIWGSDIVLSAVQGWNDPELAVETLMCAIAVAPDRDPLLRPMLLAGLRAQLSALARDPGTYPPSRYPWRGRDEPAAGFLEYLQG